MGMINAYNIFLVKKPESHLEDIGLHRRINIKIYLWEIGL
jgi:hypothetical protein